MVIDKLTGLPVVLHNEPTVEKFVAHLNEQGGQAALHAFEVGAIMHASEPTSRRMLRRLIEHGYVRQEPAAGGRRLYTLTIDSLRQAFKKRAA